MENFSVEGGRFLLNNRPQLIQSGEFHYFRTPRDLWPHRLGLLKDAGFNTVAAYIPWIWHQPGEGPSDLDGHTHPMRDLAGFIDLVSEMGFYFIARPGPYIMAETINEGIPPWVFEKSPQAAFISQDGKTQNVASYLQPDFLASVSAWYRAVFEVLTPRQITHGGKIILVQLDNEMGMIQWVRNIIDVNPDTITRFAAYLRQVYGAGILSRYPGAELEEFLREELQHPEERYSADLLQDYRRFYRDYLHRYATFLWSEARACGLEVPPVINIHGFANGGKTFPIGLSQLVEVLRMDGIISATDVYPGIIGEGTFHQLLLVDEMTKALQNKQQALFSIEFQSGGNLEFSNFQSSLHDLHTRLDISSGMRAVNHYLFFGGENDPILSPVKRHDWGHPVRTDGTLRRQYPRYQKLSSVLNAYGTSLVEARPTTVTTIGFLLDYFMTEVNNAFTRETTDQLIHQREVVLFDMLARVLALTQRPFEAVDLDRDELDAEQIPLCWAMMDHMCAAGTQQKLADYIRSGGKLVLAGRMCTEDFDRAACTILKDALGIQQIKGETTFAVKSIRAFDYQDVPATFVESYQGEFDEVFATEENGQVVGFIQKLGKGQAMVFGASIGTDTLEDIDIINQMALKMGCLPLFKLSEWADVRLSSGEKGNFLFVNNYQDDPVTTTIELDGKPLFGGKPVNLPARAGAILPLDWQLNQNVLINYVTSEIVEVRQEESRIVLRAEQDKFTAELSLSGFHCESATLIEKSDGKQRVSVQSEQGMIVLMKDAK